MKTGMLLGLAMGALALGACTATATKKAGAPLGADPELRRQNYACANGVNIIVTYDNRAQTASIQTVAGGPSTTLSHVPATSGFSYASDTHTLRNYETAGEVMYGTGRGGAPTRCRPAAA
jgi:membrane-bound inhibitor of C-type lysozyme